MPDKSKTNKASKFRMMRPVQGEYYPYAGPGFTFMPEGSTSTHVSSVFESDGKYFVAPTITNKKAPYAGYQPQSFEEALKAGEAIPFDSFEEAMFFSQNYKLPKYFDKMKKFENGGIGVALAKAVGKAYLNDLRKKASGSAKEGRDAEDKFDEIVGGYGTTGGSLDAVRHSYATGANVMDYGLKGLIAPMGHEFEAFINPGKRSAYAKDIRAGKPISSILRESFQDVYNNLYGAYLGLTSESREELFDKVSEATQDKRLLYNTEEYIEKNIQPFKKEHGGPHTNIVGPGVPQYQEGDAPIDLGMLDEITLTDFDPNYADKFYITKNLKYTPSFFGEGKYFDEFNREIPLENVIDRPSMGFAPDPTGMSIRQLLKLTKNLPKFLKYVKDLGPNKAASIGDKIQDAYYALKNIGPRAGEEVTKRIDQLKDLMNKLDDSALMIKEGQQKLVPRLDKEAVLKMEKTGDPLMGILDPADRIRGVRDFSDLVKGRTQNVKDIESKIESAKKMFNNPNIDELSKIAGENLKLGSAKAITKGEMDLMRAQNQLNQITKDYDNFLTGKNVIPDENLDMILKGTLPRQRFGKDYTEFNFTPGEGMILDTYMNPFKLNAYGGKNMPNVDYEAEGGEVVIGDISVDKAYNGGMATKYKGANMYKLGGPSHADGGIGIKMNTDEPSYVFSDRLNAGSNMTYADAASRFGDELDEINRMAMGGDIYDRNTAKRMNPRIMQDVKDLYDDQEAFKKEQGIDQKPDMAFLGGIFDNLAAGVNMTPAGAALQFLPAVLNVGKGLLGTPPEADFGTYEPMLQDYQNFTPQQRAYDTQMGRGLASLRLGLEGSGATGAQLRAGLQTGTTSAQQQAGNFYSRLGAMEMEDRARVDQANIAEMNRAEQINQQIAAQEAQFAMQNDPMQAFGTGISQVFGTAGSMRQQGFQQRLLENIFGTDPSFNADPNARSNGSDISWNNPITSQQQSRAGTELPGLEKQGFFRRLFKRKNR